MTLMAKIVLLGTQLGSDFASLPIPFLFLVTVILRHIYLNNISLFLYIYETYTIYNVFKLDLHERGIAKEILAVKFIALLMKTL